jgi:hypothetical protein
VLFRTWAKGNTKGNNSHGGGAQSGLRGVNSRSGHGEVWHFLDCLRRSKFFFLCDILSGV